MIEYFNSTTNVSTLLEWISKGFSNPIIKPPNINLTLSTVFVYCNNTKIW